MATVAADITVTLNVADADDTGTMFAAGDVLAGQETAALYFGGTGNPATVKQWTHKYTSLAAPASPDLTALPGPRGTTTTFASVTAVYIYNLDPTHPLTVGNGANPWVPGWSGATTTAPVPARSRLLLENGSGTPWAVTGGSACVLKLDPGANTLTEVRVLILGN